MFSLFLNTSSIS